MAAQTIPETAPPSLPHWEQTQADLPDAIRQVKVALRARIAASGRTVEDVFAVVEGQISAEVEELAAARQRGETIWPVIDYADIEAGTVTARARDLLRRRGCLVVRGHFDREQALGWDQDIIDYVMYIPAAPWCPRNERYAASVRDAFVTGSSPADFPAEHYERTWPNRFQPHQLNRTGRRGLGLS